MRGHSVLVEERTRLDPALVGALAAFASGLLPGQVWIGALTALSTVMLLRSCGSISTRAARSTGPCMASMS